MHFTNIHSMKTSLVSFVLITLYFAHFDSQLCHAEEGDSHSGKAGGKSVFNVMDFGARGNSPTIDTKVEKLTRY